MINQKLMTQPSFEEGVRRILAERRDLSRDTVDSQVRRLAKATKYTLDHWLGICKRCALVGDPMPWEDKM